MQLRVVIFILLCQISTVVCAQHETDFWYFMDKSSLHFESGTISVINDGKIEYAEPASSISDCRGNLLFYTDGKQVWNKDHQTMINATDLNGHYSATQGALILPWPEQCNLFYIFTLDAIEHGFENGLSYSIVDIQAQNNRGEAILKNYKLYGRASEKMAATFHKNKNSIWLVTHEMRSNRFFSYLINNTGLDTFPVISEVGGVFSSLNMGLGQMKISPDGLTVALVTLYPSEIHILDFNNQTGTLSNAIVIDANSLKGSSLYGLEFSPNSKLLYVSKHDIDYLNAPGFLYQLDLSLNTGDQILNSALIVGNNKPPSDMRGMQITNDGRIMVCKNLSNYFGIIQNPDVRGTSCNYVDEALNAGKFISHWTFTNFFSSFFSEDYQSESFAEMNKISEVCKDARIQISNLSKNSNSFEWLLADRHISADINLDYQNSDTGILELKLIAKNNYCCSDTISRFIKVLLCHEHIYIPNAFSPNGDNINDYFEIKSEDVVSINYSIFDRWGTRLQNSNAKLTEPGAFKIWDGKLNDEFCLPGVYIYLLEVKFANGAIQNFSGDLNLIR